MFVAENGEVYDDSYADEVYEKQRQEVEWEKDFDRIYLTTPVYLIREILRWEDKIEKK